MKEAKLHVEQRVEFAKALQVGDILSRLTLAVSMKNHIWGP